MSVYSRIPRPAEHLHEAACLARALISAIENLRDQDNMDSLTFRQAAQDNTFLATADGYLNDGLQSCTCKASWTYAELDTAWKAGEFSEVMYLAEENLSHEEFIRFMAEHTE